MGVEKYLIITWRKLEVENIFILNSKEVVKSLLARYLFFWVFSEFNDHDDMLLSVKSNKLLIPSLLLVSYDFMSNKMIACLIFLLFCFKLFHWISWLTLKYKKRLELFRCQIDIFTSSQSYVVHSSVSSLANILMERSHSSSGHRVDVTLCYI